MENTENNTTGTNNEENKESMKSTELTEEEKLQEKELQKKKRFIEYAQKLRMNNFYDRSVTKYNNLIWENIETADNAMVDYLNNKIFDTYRKRLNLLNNILYSTEGLPIKTRADVKKFFNIIAPLNNEHNLGTYNWTFKDVEKRLYIHNSLLKVDLNINLKIYFLNPIKRVLKLSGVNFKYYEFKSMRYYRSVDIVFVVDF